MYWHNKDETLMKRNRGFTLIELVVVVVLLGILAATALPRFIDLGGNARDAANRGIAGAFQSGINLARSMRDVASPGQEFIMNFGGSTGTTVYFTAAGTGTWPVGAMSSGTTSSALGCQDLYNALLVNGPTVMGATIANGSAAVLTGLLPVVQNMGAQYLAFGGAGGGCVYVRTDGSATARNAFAYNAMTGVVTFTGPSGETDEHIVTMTGLTPPAGGTAQAAGLTALQT